MDSKGKQKEKEYLRIAEAGKLLGVHPNTLRNWEEKGILTPVRVGVRKERRYRRVDVIKLREENK